MSRKPSNLAPPRVSVVMSVYNGAAYLKAAIDSILAQTFADFECIIIDDGSTDTTKKIIRSYADSRIRLVEQTNHGLVFSLNQGLKLARADLIARMDADDISLPERLTHQVAFLDAHPDHVLVGCGLSFIDAQGHELYPSPLLVNDPEIRLEMLVRCPFAHGSVMYRHEPALQAGGYRQAAWPAEDYDLWHRLSAFGKFANLDSILFQYREHAAGISQSNQAIQVAQTATVREATWADPAFSTIPSFSTCIRPYKSNSAYARIQRARLTEVYWLVAGRAWKKRLLRRSVTMVISSFMSRRGSWLTVKYLIHNVLSF
jgi:glycosyltransferase involved in cell wall biosynthesis